MNLFFKLNTKINTNADDIINNILQTGKIPNISRLNGNKIIIGMSTFMKMIQTIQVLMKECNESEIKINLLRNRIKELELNQYKDNNDVKHEVCNYTEVCIVICFGYTL